MHPYVVRESQAAAPGAPLFLVFHGTGGDENQFFGLAEKLLPNARVVAPRGDVSEGGALRYFRRLGNGIYDMDDLARRTTAMAGFVASLRDAHQPSRIVGLGYSNGANILAAVQFAHPSLFDDSILLHPLIPWTPEPVALNRARILLTAGRRDPMAPAAMTEQLASAFRANGAYTELVWHEGGHELRQEELVAAQRFLGAGGAAS